MEHQLTQGRADFSLAESESLNSFITEGCPGILSKTDSDMYQWFELYMSGKTYSEISKITNTKKDLILYISAKCNWHDKRMQYYSDLSSHMLQKCNESKLETLNTVTTMVSALNNYFGGKFDKFLKTKDESIIEGLDTKLLAQYYKATEAIDKIVGSSVDQDNKPPLVNINMTSSAKVTQTGKNTLEIDTDSSEKEREVGEILKSLAKLKKIRDNGDE